MEALTKKGGDPSGDAMKELLLRMEDRWGRMEAAFREGMNSRSDEVSVKHVTYKSYFMTVCSPQPQPRRKYRAGDLESDHDENYEAINTKMKLSSSKIINLELEVCRKMQYAYAPRNMLYLALMYFFVQHEGVQASFKRLQEQHEKDMTEIRTLLKSLQGQSSTAPQPLPVAVESSQTVISGHGAESRKMSRWNDLAGATGPDPVECSGSGEAPVVLEDKMAKQVETVTNVRKAAKKLARPKPTEEKPLPSEVTISFHKRHNHSLSDKLLEKIDVVVPR